MSAGVLTLNDDYTIPTVSLTGGTITGPGDLVVTHDLAMSGPISMTGGNAATTTLRSGAAAAISVQAVTITLGRTLSLAAGSTTTISGSGNIGGGGSGSGTIVNAGSVAISGNTGISVSVTNGASGTLTSSATSSFSNAFRNDGQIVVSAGVLSITGAFANYNQATDVLTGGVYHVNGTLRFTGADIKTNAATIVLDGTPSLIQDTVPADGFRDLAANPGTLSIIGGRSLTLPTALASSGTLIVGTASALSAPSVTITGGTLSGSGTIHAPVTNGGTVLPGTSPGILTVDGTYNQGTSGALNIEIAGTTPGTGHDQLAISGAATLNGALRLSTTGGFVPSNGQTFTILTYASHTGCFTTIDGRDLAGVGQGMFYDVDCGPTSAVVTTRRAEISIADASITEGDDGTQALSFTVSQNVRRPDLGTSVAFATADGTATSPADFAAAAGTLTFGAGDTNLTRLVTVDVKGDLLDEFDEHFAVNLSAATNAVITFGSAAGTILDNDPPPTASIADVSVDEVDTGTTNATFTVSLSRPSGKPISIAYAATDGTATAGDYTAATGTLNFAPGDTTQDITVAVTGDVLDEFDETFLVSLFDESNVELSDAVATGTILDNDPPPTVSISDATVVEGDTGTAHLTVTVSLSAPSGKPIFVDYATADGTAQEPGDYTATADTLAFAAGETSATITVDVIGDTLDEFNETFAIVLSNGLNVVIDDGSALATITDDDPEVAVSVDDVTVTEGDTGTASAGFTVSLSAASGKTVTVDYATADGTAAKPADYTAASGTLTFAPGQTSQPVAISVRGDLLDEPDETFRLVVSNASNAMIATGTGTGTILDDDPQPSVSIADSSVDEGDSGTTDATLTVSLSAPSGRPITVAFAATDGTATAADYTATHGILSFAPGVTTQTITIAVTGDVLDEFNETFLVTLSDPTNATLGDGVATGTITDDDAAPTVSIGDATVAEGNAGSVPLTVTVSLSAASGKAISVDYATADSTAVHPADYTAASGTVTFVPGETSHTITVSVLGDTLDEVNETFTIGLSNPSNATVADGSGLATITDDDPAVTVSVDDVAVAEGDTGTTAARFTVSLSAASGKTVTVDYATADGTASSPGDYTAGSGTLTFAPGVTSQHVDVDVVGDTVFEADETFRLALSNPANASLADASGTAAIQNDDAAVTAEISIADAAATEGDSGTTPMTFAVTLSTASAQTVTVTYATADGTALQPADYAAASGTVTFLPGQTSREITVDVHGDVLDEPNEMFSVSLSSPTNATIDDGSATGTITDDDPAATVSIGDATVAEGNTGSVPLTVTVSLSAPSAKVVTVGYATADGSAVHSADYTAASGTVTFAAGETSHDVSVNVLGDTLDEANETFTIGLSNPSNATIGDGSGTGTITDDDATPTLTIGDRTVLEGDAGTTPATFTVTLSAPSGRTVTVQYATAAGTATTPADYASASGTLTFAPGDTSRAIVVNVQGDTLDESNETFNVNLTSPSGAGIADGTGLGTITDDDPKPAITSVSPASVIQGATITIRGSHFTGATTVTFARAGGGTVNATSFNVASDTRLTAVVPAGATSGRVSVTTGNGTATSATDLVIEPSIASFSPGSGPVGTTVTITGSGFTGATAVRFGSTPAVTFTVVSDTQITTRVPVGASSGKISVVTPGATDTSKSKFTVQ
ncbi:MAG: beta strand repeat-containing protein [Chloroflexota bacterium]